MLNGTRKSRNIIKAYIKRTNKTGLVSSMNLTHLIAFSLYRPCNIILNIHPVGIAIEWAMTSVTEPTLDGERNWRFSTVIDKNKPDNTQAGNIQGCLLPGLTNAE